MEKINNKSRQEMSKEFMLLQGEIRTTREFKRLLLKCIMEEVVELAQGLGVTDNDIRAMFLSAKRASHTSNESKVEVLDALVDTEYFLNQIKTVYNISEENYHEAYTRVHHANMNKCIDGKLIISDGTGDKPKGKILKPEGWKEADISDLV